MIPFARPLTNSTRTGSWLSSAGPVLLSVLAIPVAFGLGEGDKEVAGNPRFASDPTVGTLPVVGQAPEEFDQTLALRGNQDEVREALGSIVLGPGARLETIDLGGGDVWVRFFGTLSVELDLEEAGDVEVEIFSGFDGGGMKYAVRTGGSFGAVATLDSGGTLPVQVQRLASLGLFDAPVSLRALHASGQLTETSFVSAPAAANGRPMLLVEQLVR